jgi:hypothetical protein
MGRMYKSDCEEAQEAKLTLTFYRTMTKLA